MNNDFEYVYSPVVRLRRIVIFVVALMLSGVILGIASVEKSFFSPFFSVISAALLIGAVLIAVRFIGTRYVYSVRVNARGEGELTVRELRGFFGKRNEVRVNRTVCRVSLLDVRELFVFDDAEKGKKDIRALKKRIRREGAALYDYSAELLANEWAVLSVRDGDGASYIKFSPDGELIRILSK